MENEKVIDKTSDKKEKTEKKEDTPSIKDSETKAEPEKKKDSKKTKPIERHLSSSPSQENNRRKTIRPTKVVPPASETLSDDEPSDEERSDQESDTEETIKSGYKKWPVFPKYINSDQNDAEWLVYQLAVPVNKRTNEDAIKELVARVHHISINYTMAMKKVYKLSKAGRRLEGESSQKLLAECDNRRAQLLDCLGLTDINS